MVGQEHDEGTLASAPVVFWSMNVQTFFTVSLPQHTSLLGDLTFSTNVFTLQMWVVCWYHSYTMTLLETF